MRTCHRLISLVAGVLSLFVLATADGAVTTLHRAGDLLYRDPKTSKFLIQDRIVPPAKPLGAENSADLSSQMPPVGDQGSQGSCVAWSMGYYHKTHNEWVEHHWDVDSAKYQASPAFVYNQICGGEDAGSFFEDAGKLMSEQGAGNMAEMPFNQNDCTTWPAESTYLHAISWRCDSCYWINIANNTGLARVKARLDSGYTTTLGIWVWSNFDNIIYFDTVYCASQVYGTNRGGHALTFVGYDDSKVTADGTGAFRMVNSWGTGWGHAGYCWISYQAVEDTDARGKHGITQGAAYYVTDKLGYTPTLLGRVKITHNFRDCVEIRLGVGRTGSPLWTKNFRDFDMRKYKVVPQPFPKDTIVFDMTGGASYLAGGSTDSVFVRCLDDSSDSRTGTINYFSGQYVPWGVTGVSTDPPVSIPDYNVAAYARAAILAGQDVGCTKIIAPTGTIDSGTSVTPACSLANYGGVSEGGFPVLLRVGTGSSHIYDQTANAPTIAPGQTAYLAFPSTNIWPRGTYPVTCSTELASDDNPANNAKTGSVTVQVVDAAVTQIVVPSGGVDSGTVINPQVRITNRGTLAELIPMNLKFAGVYDASRSKTIAVGMTDTVNFPSWAANLALGNYATRCTLSLAGDAVKTNDTLSGTFAVAKPDVGVVAILAPSDTIQSGAIAPSATVQNYGFERESFRVFFRISGGYFDSVTVSLGGGQSGTVSFANWTATPGVFTTRCSTGLASDVNRANDTLSGSVVVQSVYLPGWTRMSDLPPGAKSKNVKDGGALAYGTQMGNDSGFVFALKGNSTYEFDRYNVESNTWVARDSIPAYGRSMMKKAVKKGSSLVMGTDGRLYATKGNNTNEFWQCDPSKPAGTTWTEMVNEVPPGSKACREGVSMAAATIGGANYIYFLKGSGTYEFYRFNVDSKTWTTLPDAPSGPLSKPYKVGSSIAYDGGDTVYCLKGSYNEFYAYSIAGNKWVTLETLPKVAPPGTRKTKVKDGSQLAYTGRVVYALKGDNTNEFWTYLCNSHLWYHGTDMPAYIKRVNGGGALVASAGGRELYAFRGNNTLEFWSYRTADSIAADPLATDRQPKGVQGQSATRSPQLALSVTPNLFSPSLNPSISYSLPVASDASLRLYDMSGRLVAVLASGYHPAGSYSCSQLTASPSLAGGVYLLKLDAGSQHATLKLVVE